MAGTAFRLPWVPIAVGLIVVGGGAGVVGYAGGAVGSDVIVLLLVLAAVVAVLPSIYYNATVGGPVNHMREVLHTTRIDGDLVRRVLVPAASRVAPAADAYNELMASFQGIITRVLFNSNQLAQAAEKLIGEARETASSSEQQNSAAESAATAVTGMTQEMNRKLTTPRKPRAWRLPHVSTPRAVRRSSAMRLLKFNALRPRWNSRPRS